MMLIDEQNIDQIINTIRTVHQTTVDHRLIDLTEYLTEFFQSIQPHQSNLFRILTNLLHDYKDSAALKVEFLQAGCLEIIYQRLTDDEENTTSILKFIIELLNDSENVREKFLHFNGYEKFFNSLRHIHSPTIHFIDQIIILMIQKTALRTEDSLASIIDSYVIFTNTHIAVSLIYWIPYLIDSSFQHYIISSITKIILRSSQNKMMACSNGIILALLQILNNNNHENSTTLKETTSIKIFSLLENLSRFSINPREIRYICQLFYQNFAFKKQALHLLIEAAKQNDPDVQSIFSYFDLQQANSGIVVPIIHRWPSLAASSTSHHFSFHCWLKINDDIHSYSYEGRRQIYSFYSDSVGLESFIRSSSLFVSISDHRELAYIEIKDCTDLVDGRWHSLTIVHRGQRPSIFTSGFLTAQTYQLTIYIDGLIRKEIKDFKYVSFANDSIKLASIGSPSQHPKSSVLKMKNESLSTTIARSIQPLKGLLSMKTKNSNNHKENSGNYSENVIVVSPNIQDTIFGPSTTLYGQLASVWILTETLEKLQVQYLHNMGSDFCRQHDRLVFDDNISKSATIFDLLSNHSVLAYHPLACNGHICIDVSGGSSRIHGRLINCSSLCIDSFFQSILKLGGCSILYPLIESFQEHEYVNLNDMHISIENQSLHECSPDSNEQLNSNPIVSMIYLIHYILSFASANILIEQMIKQYNIEILGKYLQRISPCFIDEQLLVSIQELIASSLSMNPSNVLTTKLMQCILFNFDLWNKAKFHVRLLHFQYLSNVIQYDKIFNREKFGVQFFLDILKNYLSDNNDEQRQLRDAIYEIVKYFIQNFIHIQDLNALLYTLSTLSMSNDILTHELLNFILQLLESSSITTERIIELLCKSNMAQELYSLLVMNNLSSETKEIVLKIMRYFLESNKVSQKARDHLRLKTNNIGFGGIMSGIALNDLNSSIVQEILNLVITSDSIIAIHHLNIILTICSAASLDVRCIAMRTLITYFIKHPSACQLYAKCYGWQETLANFFVKTRRSSIVKLLPDRVISPTVESTYNNDQNLDSSQENFDDINIENSDLESVPMTIFDIESCQEESIIATQNSNSDLSTEVNATIEFNLSLKTRSSENSLVSNGLEASLIILDNKAESTADLQSCANETIMIPPPPPPPLSNSSSREDLSFLFETENCNSNRIETDSKNNDRPSSLPKAITVTSISNNAVDSTSCFRSSIIADEGDNILEETCETLILVIVMIIWKGIIDCDDAAWINRGQIFSALRHLHREYNLYLPLDYIERRILELSMEACLNDIKLDGGRRRISFSAIRKETPTFETNCHELIKLVHDFLVQSSDNNSKRITESLVKGIFPILDTMLLFKKDSTNGESKNALTASHDYWSETFLTGLHILLILLAHSNISICGQASIRIHSLLNCRPLNRREEAAYLLSSVNNILLSMSTIDDSEHCTYILSLMKIIIDKSFSLLKINLFLPDISGYKSTFETLDDLRRFILSTNREDWQSFIQKMTEPYADHYQSMSVRPFQMNMKIWWNNCHETMTMGIQKRNQQIGIEKLKFQNDVIQPWYQRSRLDDQRTSRLNEFNRIHQIYIENEWKIRKKYLFSERGLYSNSNRIQECHWMLSNRENMHRMRCKLIENDCFNDHKESSRLRDNIDIDKYGENTSNKCSKNEKKPNPINKNELFYVSNESKSFFFEDKENILLGTKCSLITSTSIADGEFIITDKHIYFFELTQLTSCQNNFKYPLFWLQDILLRRYNLRPTALEFFLVNRTNFFLNFDKNIGNSDKKIRQKIIQKLLSFRLPSTKSIFPSFATNMTPKQILIESIITQKWIVREISNFDYLMMLNTIAGRTYNDLNQYPIFPWILKDYTSSVLDINNPNVFRDLSKPIGIQNSKHIEEVKSKYESFDDPTGLIKKFHYGTHYSNAASVMHYLIRMEPFTTLHIQLQSGKFDIADRQFHSFQSSWINIMDSPNDGKELIPEFFYLPEFLLNSDRFDLGKLQSNNQPLNDVLLPPWANHSPEEFIRLHRSALESDHVSAHLHKWIDLIFGYKQTGQPAIDALNVFMHCSYEQVIAADTSSDSITREAIDGMIQNFGRIPAQLFTEPHPKRKTREQVIFQTQSQGRSLNLFQNIDHIKAFFLELTSTKNETPIRFISIAINHNRSYVQQNTCDALITINEDGIVGNNGWYSYDKSLNDMFSFERDPTLEFEKHRLSILVPFAPSININTRLFAISHDSKLIFSGGHWDWSLCVYSLPKSKTVNSITHHTDIVTCLALDSTGYILVTGSRDTTCVVWYLSSTDNRRIANIGDQETISMISPQRTLYGHTATITCVSVSSELDLVISGSLDGTCNMYTIENGTYIRTLKPTGDNYDPIIDLKLSDERHILVQTKHKDTYLFLYSINGYLVRTRKFQYDIADMILVDQYIILAVNHDSMWNGKIDAVSSAVTRIIIKDMFEMTTIRTIRLRAQINCFCLTKDLSHLIISVKDGKLFVLTTPRN